MSRNWTRRVAALGVVPVTALSVLVATSAPAQANSGIGLAQNAWLVTDLASEVANKAQTLPYDPVLEAELATAAAATTKTTAKPGVTVKPKPSGKLGLIVNTVAMLGGFALTWGGGGETLPSPPAGEGATAGAGTCGWASGGISIVACGTTSATLKMTYPTASGRSGYLWHITNNGWTSGAWNNNETFAYTRPTDARVEMQARYGQSKDYATTTPFGRVWLNPRTSTAPQWDTNPSPGTAPAPHTVPRRIESKAECRGKDGTLDVLSQLSEAFTIDPAQPKELPEAPDVQCAPGRWLEKGTRELVTEGTTEKMPLTEPYTSPPWVEQQVTNFPECFPGGTAKCVLELIRKATATSPELNCNSVLPSSSHACRSWMTDPNKANRYECRYGGAVVALRRCEPYANSFTQTPTLTRTPEDPDGAPTPAPAPGTDPSPGDTPNLTGCTPEWAELLSPWWVFKAASCALAWAFIPPTGYLDAKVGTLRTQWNGTTPGLWLGKVNGLVTVPTGNCGGIPVDVDLGHGVAVDAQLGEACSGRMATTAGLIKLAATAFICVGGAFAGVRILGAGLGWAPGIGKGVES